MAGRPRTREAQKLGKVCGAKTRKGTPCQCKLLYKKKNGAERCGLHGGKSTGAKFAKPGPKTPEGIAARNAGRDRYFRERRAVLSVLSVPTPPTSKNAE